MEQREYVKRLAIFLCDNGMKMSVKELAEHLNRNDFKTTYGTEYEGKRGTYRLIKTTYDWLILNGQQLEASNVADTFTKSNGDYAYKIEN